MNTALACISLTPSDVLWDRTGSKGIAGDRQYAARLAGI